MYLGITSELDNLLQFQGRKDFIKREKQPKPEPAKEEPEENVYESIEQETNPKESDLGDGPVRRPRKRASVSNRPFPIF